jgi:hypothetical protein
VIKGICLILLACVLGAPAQAEEVDLEIVLALDASGSVDEHEFRLQLGGVAEALRHPSVHEAIVSGPYGRIAVSLLVWSDSAFPRFATDWVVLDSPGVAMAYADVVEGFHSKVGRSKGIGGGGTAIGDALAYAIIMLDNNGIDALRQTVDVSGDGIETPPWFKAALMLPEARQMAVERGVLVNGLAITTDFANLTAYYRDNVIVGPGAFVIEARGFEDFRRAILEKMRREFTFAVTSRLESGVGGKQVAWKAD